MPFKNILTRLERAIEHASKNAPEVSARGVDWHLEHSLKIINSICKTLAESKPENYKPKFNIGKYYILWSNGIPRGKGRSPTAFNNKEAIDASKLPERLENAKKNLASLDGLHAKHHFPHPMFGDLNLKEAKKFIHIHTAHHLKIMDEIIKTS